MTATRETEPVFKKALKDIFAAPENNGNASASDSVPASHWTLQTDECRHNTIMVAFDDDQKFFINIGREGEFMCGT